MLQVVATLFALMVTLAEGDSQAKRDVYRFVPITRKPTRRTYARQAARADGYTARPTSYAQSGKSDGLTKMFGRRFNVGSDVTKRPTTRRYPAAKDDGFMKYFRKYFTRRPTQRYNVQGDSRYFRPTQRPTARIYGMTGKFGADYKTKKPTTRVYDVRGDARKGRPTKPYVARVAADDKKVDESATKEVVPEPEHLDKKYFHMPRKLGWNAAQEACARRGAQLATIHSVQEHERVSHACAGECWLGAQRGAKKFEWSDESAMDFEKWGDRKKGLCAKISASKLWTSADCDSKLASVCQKMEWKANVETVKDEYGNVASLLVRGKSALFVVGFTVVVVILGIVAKYACGKRDEKHDTEAPSDETTPLLWTRE